MSDHIHLPDGPHAHIDIVLPRPWRVVFSKGARRYFWIEWTAVLFGTGMVVGSTVVGIIGGFKLAQYLSITTWFVFALSYVVIVFRTIHAHRRGFKIGAEAMPFMVSTRSDTLRQQLVERTIEPWGTLPFLAVADMYREAGVEDAEKFANGGKDE